MISPYTTKDHYMSMSTSSPIHWELIVGHMYNDKSLGFAIGTQVRLTFQPNHMRAEEWILKSR
jgi:hypothetical protein